MKQNKVALAPFLRSCAGITTLGVRPTIDDYSEVEKELLRFAERVFFPTPRFAYLFNALHIPTFPSYSTYRFRHSRVLQQILLSYLQIPHPTTRIYFGNSQKADIARAFPFPFLAMGPVASVHQRQFVDNPATLDECCRSFNPLIIQEAVTWTERVRILCVGADCVGIIRRTGSPAPDNRGEPASLQHPDLQPVLDAARKLVRSVQLDDIVLEWGYGDGQWQLVEMVRPPVQWPTTKGVLNRHQYICELVRSGRL